MRDDATMFEELVTWLDAVTKKKAVRIELRHKSSEGRVREWRVDEGTDARELALDVTRGVESDGRAMRGSPLYALLAYREGAGPYFERLFLTALARADRLADDDGASVTAADLVEQSMRHTEASARLAIGHSNEIVRHYQRMLEMAHQRIGELEKRLSRSADLYEALTTSQHERDLEVMRAKVDEKKQDFFREKLDLLLPIAMNKLLGQGGKGGKPVLGEEMIRQLLKSLRQDQFDRIMGALEPEQIALMGEIYQGYGEREMAKEAKKANGAANGVNGAAHAAPPGEGGTGS
jgi:hypothetical protein